MRRDKRHWHHDGTFARIISQRFLKQISQKCFTEQLWTFLKQTKKKWKSQQRTIKLAKEIEDGEESNENFRTEK